MSEALRIVAELAALSPTGSNDTCTAWNVDFDKARGDGDRDDDDGVFDCDVQVMTPENLRSWGVNKHFSISVN